MCEWCTHSGSIVVVATIPLVLWIFYEEVFMSDISVAEPSRDY